MSDWVCARCGEMNSYTDEVDTPDGLGFKVIKLDVYKCEYCGFTIQASRRCYDICEAERSLMRVVGVDPENVYAIVNEKLRKRIEGRFYELK